MREMFVVVLAAILLPIAVVTGQTTTTLPQPPQITVSGTAEIKVVADQIELSMAVETRGDKLDDTKRQNDERVAKVLQFLKGQGVPDKDVQTAFMVVTPTYDTKISRSDVITYVVRKTIGARLTDVSKFDTVLTGLLQNGVNHVDSINFGTSALRKHRDEARARAIKAAQEKADALASELGVKRGKVYNITATEGGGWWGSRGAAQNVMQEAAGASGQGGETFSVGQISVTATVNVSFLIE
jgi:uncharacterized protein